ncbi:NADAR family protein, partial [Escherichia coli]
VESRGLGDVYKRQHYFQAQKFLDEKYREEIRRVSSPMVAARMGRDRSKPLRKNWESVKEQVMRKALRAKFEQHAEPVSYTHLRAHETR